MNRLDYQSAVKALFSVLECIHEIYDKVSGFVGKTLPYHIQTGSDMDGTDISCPGNYLAEIEEGKFEDNFGSHRRTSSIPR